MARHTSLNFLGTPSPRGRRRGRGFVGVGEGPGEARLGGASRGGGALQGEGTALAGDDVTASASVVPAAYPRDDATRDDATRDTHPIFPT